MIVPFIFILIASFFLGTFGLGMKYNKPLSWEIFWSIHFLTAFCLVPSIWALIVVPEPFKSIITAPSDAIVRGIIFGFIWGIGGVLFGLSIKYVGVSLTYGIVMGTTGTIGALVPLIQIPDFFSQNNFPFIIAGILLMISGVVVVAFAGIKRENLLSASGASIEGISKGKDFRKGLFIVIIGGIFSAFINIGFINAAAIGENAVSFGSAPIHSSIIVWVVVLWGAIFLNIMYVSMLFIKNKSFSGFSFRNIGKPVFWAVFSGILWFGSMGFYGYGAEQMGVLGPILGWPVFVGISLIFSNIWAIRAGEWENTGKLKIILFTGILLLIVASVVLGYSNRI